MTMLYTISFVTPVPVVFQPFHKLGLFIFRSVENLQLVFYAAVACHVLEALYAVSRCFSAGVPLHYTLAWFTSVTIFGC